MDSDDEDVKSYHGCAISGIIKDGVLKIKDYTVEGEETVKEIPLENIREAEFSAAEFTVINIKEKEEGMVECPHPNCNKVFDSEIVKEEHLKFEHAEKW